MKRSFKKLILSAAGVALVAMLLPALASATELQAESKPGEPMPVGSTILAESEYLEVENAALWGDWECGSASAQFKLAENGGATVALVGQGGEAGPCWRNSQSMSMEEFIFSKLVITKPGEGTAAVSLTGRFSGSIECSYEGEGTFTYETGSDEIQIQGLQLSSADETCEPPEEEGHPKLNGNFSLSKKESGEKVLIVERPASWTLQSPGSAKGSLHDVACTSPSTCVAVGINGGGSALAERWASGKWSSTEVSGFGLTSVACSSSGSYFCIAPPSQGLEVKRWSGSKWSTTTAVLPSEATSVHFKGVSCGSDTYGYCIAVGTYEVGGGKTRTLAELYDGSKWTVLTIPNEEAGYNNRLDAVSCPTSVSCMAIGVKAGNPVALQWNGSAWSAVAAPEHQGLLDVSCTSGSACMAVGWGNAERWNGSEWIATTAAQVGSYPPMLKAVSCVADECIATGSYETPSWSVAPLAERWNGSEWEAQEAVDPEVEAEEEMAELHGVSCSTVSRCTAVGFASSYEGLVPLIERYQ